MSNHAHVVVRIDRDRAVGWSVEEVLERWTALFTGPVLVREPFTIRLRYFVADNRQAI